MLPHDAHLIFSTPGDDNLLQKWGHFVKDKLQRDGIFYFCYMATCEQCLAAAAFYRMQASTTRGLQQFNLSRARRLQNIAGAPSTALHVAR